MTPYVSSRISARSGCGYLTSERSCLARQYDADVLHRARAVERHERHQLGDAVGPQLLDRAPHARRLQLEDAEGVAAAEHRRTSSRRRPAASVGRP